MHLLLIMMLFAADSGSFRCGTQLVTPGASKLEVISRCGEPAWRERVSGANESSREVWIYPSPGSGSQKLLHFDGVSLIAIQDARVGASRQGGTDSHRCGNALIRLGETKPEVKRQCGEPVLVEEVSGADGVKQEVWLYAQGDTAVALHFAGVQLERIERRIR